MKTKLTLTIDPVVTHKAKLVAKERGISLSAMVEQALKQNTGITSPTEKSQPFSQRWRGGLQLRDDSSPRIQKLKDKYGLSPES